MIIYTREGPRKIGRAHVRRIGRHSFERNFYFVTTSTRNRQTIFSNAIYAKIAVEAFTAPALLKDNQLMCWVLMPDHVHWLFQLGASTKLSALVSSMKSASSRRVRQAGYTGEVWGQGYHDSRVRHSSGIPRISRYIINNPVKAGLVRRADQYLYCSEWWKPHDM